MRFRNHWKRNISFLLLGSMLTHAGNGIFSVGSSKIYASTISPAGSTASQNAIDTPTVSQNASAVFPSSDSDYFTAISLQPQIKALIKETYDHYRDENASTNFQVLESEYGKLLANAWTSLLRTKDATTRSFLEAEFNRFYPDPTKFQTAASEAALVENYASFFPLLLSDNPVFNVAMANVSARPLRFANTDEVKAAKIAFLGQTVKTLSSHTGDADSFQKKCDLAEYYFSVLTQKITNGSSTSGTDNSPRSDQKKQNPKNQNSGSQNLESQTPDNQIPENQNSVSEQEQAAMLTTAFQFAMTTVLHPEMTNPLNSYRNRHAVSISNFDSDAVKASAAECVPELFELIMEHPHSALLMIEKFRLNFMTVPNQSTESTQISRAQALGTMIRAAAKYPHLESFMTSFFEVFFGKDIPSEALTDNVRMAYASEVGAIIQAGAASEEELSIAKRIYDTYAPRSSDIRSEAVQIGKIRAYSAFFLAEVGASKYRDSLLVTAAGYFPANDDTTSDRNSSSGGASSSSGASAQGISDQLQAESLLAFGYLISNYPSGPDLLRSDIELYQSMFPKVTDLHAPAVAAANMDVLGKLCLEIAEHPESADTLTNLYDGILEKANEK